MSTTIILDCDPGIDDALAVASFVGAVSVPVTAGCAAPLLRPALDAGHVHGESGLGGAVLPRPPRPAASGHAIDFIIAGVAAAPGEITLVATGPLTNVALALRREPRLASWVRDFVIMGGSAGRGNVNHAAEFNMWADPEAAAVVFAAGWTVRMIGLDVTLRALATLALQERMRSFGVLGSELLLPALARYADSNNSTGEPPVHDVCAVVSVAEPSVFRYTPALVQVETTGKLTSGMTVTDFSTSVIPNALVATEIDVGRFWEVVLRTYQSLAASLG